MKFSTYCQAPDTSLTDPYFDYLYKIDSTTKLVYPKDSVKDGCL